MSLEILVMILYNNEFIMMTSILVINPNSENDYKSDSIVWIFQSQEEKMQGQQKMNSIVY
jgi:hypothetical protein